MICRRSDGKEVEDRSCPSPKPDTRRVVPCRDESNCSYSYVADPWGPWGKCSIDCGYGTQTRTRTVRCVDGDGNQVPTRMCEQMKPRPPKPTDKEGKRCTGPRCRYTSSCRYRVGRGRSYCERYFGEYMQPPRQEERRTDFENKRQRRTLQLRQLLHLPELVGLPGQSASGPPQPGTAGDTTKKRATKTQDTAEKRDETQGTRSLRK